MNTEQTIVDDSPISEHTAALAELGKQGLTIRLHSIQNNTWHIADGGLYSGYIASETELVPLLVTVKFAGGFGAVTVP